MGNVNGSHIAKCAMATLCVAIFFFFAGNAKAADARNSGANNTVQARQADIEWLLARDGSAGEAAGVERQGAGSEERDFDDPDFEEHENLQGEHAFGEPEEQEFEEHEDLPREGEGHEFREHGEFGEPEWYGFREPGEFEEPEEHEYREREFQEHEQEFPDEDFFSWPGDEFYGIPNEEFFEGPENFFEGPYEGDFYERPEYYERPRGDEFFERHEGQGFEEPGEEHFREEAREGIHSEASE